MGQTLSEPITDKNSSYGINKDVLYGLSSMQGWRISMEDAHSAKLSLKCPYENQEVDFFAVYDGHGGEKVAKWCGERLPSILEESEEFKKGDFVNGLKASFLKADQMILEDEQFHTDPSGCTATVLLRANNKIYCANAGDSRTVLGRKGVAKALSVDHKPSNESEKARICAAGGFVDFGRVNGNLALSRAIGDFEFKNSNLEPEKQIVTSLPDVIVHEVTDEDEFVVLACDGIWDCKTSQQVIEFVRRGIVAGLSLQEISESLMDNCIAGDTETTGLGCDNMTVCVVGLLQGDSQESWYKKIADRVAAHDGPCGAPELAESRGPGFSGNDNGEKIIVPSGFQQIRVNRIEGHDPDADEDDRNDDSANGSLAAGFRWKEHFFPEKAEDEKEDITTEDPSVKQVESAASSD
ncbi:protein phosphatase 2C Ptc3 [Schizosaccharomyces octosporus yFS286]|uniref:protein-serine/threonine phosphatase n=1 Tax=Schizosaccharomyces octosporus (strain yFS286) TaxID=483514 RepID=S9Q3C5_SCHOY|nr:protein phosphatase 2C Ptc3 [Schizosaccharomyces octosporus yFS286]EPX74577.1 protein phosphatase 2C Ptc3 [Schizosaccharomyces octosporus yFS286]